MEFTVDGMTATGNGKAVVSLPWVGKTFGIVNFILEGTGLEKRKYTLETFVACGLDEQVSIKLGDGFTGAVSLPSNTPVDDEGLSYHRSRGVPGPSPGRFAGIGAQRRSSLRPPNICCSRRRWN